MKNFCVQIKNSNQKTLTFRNLKLSIASLL